MGLFSTVKRKVLSYISKPRKPSKPISTSQPERRAKPAPTAQTSAPASTPSSSPHANNAGSSNITSRPANNTNIVRSSGGGGGGQSPTPPTSPHENNAGSPNITSRPASETNIKRSSLTDDVDRHWDAEKAYKAGVGAAQGVEVSEFSKKVHTKSKEVAETIRKGAPVVGDKIGGVAGQAIQYPIRSTAVLVETAGMVLGGGEVIARKPDVIKPAVEFGLYQSTVGTAKEFKKDPLQVTSDLATVFLFTHGVAKGGGALYGRAAQAGSKVTAGINKVKITKKTTPQDFLLKVEDVPAGASTVTDTVAITPHKPNQIQTFTGKVKDGKSDLFIKLDPASAKVVSKRYTGEIQNIKTDHGSFVEFTPTGEIPATNAPLIGGGNPKTSILDAIKQNSPYRFETKKTIEPASLIIKNAGNNKALPKFTYDAETTGVVVADSLMLKSGKVGLFESESASLRPTRLKDRINTNDMSWMNERVKLTDTNLQPIQKASPPRINRPYKEFEGSSVFDILPNRLVAEIKTAPVGLGKGKHGFSTPSLGSMLGVGLNVPPSSASSGMSTDVMSGQQTNMQPIQVQKPNVVERLSPSFLTSRMHTPASKQANPSPMMNLFSVEPMMPKIQTITPPHAKQTSDPVDSMDILTGSRKKRHNVKDPLDFLMG